MLLYFANGALWRNFVKVKNVKLLILFKTSLPVKSSKLDDLGNTAGETNGVQSHRPRVFTYYAFGQFRGGPGGNFAVDTV